MEQDEMMDVGNFGGAIEDKNPSNPRERSAQFGMLHQQVNIDKSQFGQSMKMRDNSAPKQE